MSNPPPLPAKPTFAPGAAPLLTGKALVAAPGHTPLTVSPGFADRLRTLGVDCRNVRVARY